MPFPFRAANPLISFFAACPDFVPAHCAWLLSRQLFDNDNRAVIGFYYGANLLEVNKGADNRAQSGVFGKAEVLIDKAKQFPAKCSFKTTLPAGPIPHQFSPQRQSPSPLIGRHISGARFGSQRVGKSGLIAHFRIKRTTVSPLEATWRKESIRTRISVSLDFQQL